MNASAHLLATLLLAPVVHVTAQEASRMHTTSGTIALAGGGVSLRLGRGDRYVAGAEAREVLERLWGNAPDDRVVGLVLPRQTEGDPPWAAVVSYHADSWIAGGDSLPPARELLERTRAQLTAGVEPGEQAAIVQGWVLEPEWRREAGTLRWGLRLRFPGDELDNVNLHHVQLLRDGWLEFVLLCPVPAEQFLADRLAGLADALEVGPDRRWSEGVAHGDRTVRTAADLITGVADEPPSAAPREATDDPPGRRSDAASTGWLWVCLAPLLLALVWFGRRAARS